MVDLGTGFDKTFTAYCHLQRFKLAHIATGDLIRDEIRAKSALGLQVRRRCRKNQADTPTLCPLLVCMSLRVLIPVSKACISCG